MLISEIAQRAKVSPATVSRVINQPHLVAADKLAKIQAVMAEVNYTPAPLHRRRGPKARLATPKQIGVWFVGAQKNPSLSWFQEELLNVQSSLERQPIEISVLYSHSANEPPRAALERQIDGIILLGGEPTEECMRKLSEIPHIWFMTRRNKDFPGDYVEPDNEMNGHLAAEFLHAQGHKSVAAISTEPTYTAIAWRVAAFAARAAELGLRCQSILGEPESGISYLQHTPSHRESESLAKRLLNAKPRPTGLYVPVDHACGSFFRATRQVGLQHGTDYEAILGNYNPVIYHNLDHLPAALDINLSTLVRKVVDQLLWRIENPQATGRAGCTISPTLITPK